MKARFLMNALAVVALAVFFTGCQTGTKTGAGKQDINSLIDAYGKENSLLAEELKKKEQELNLLKADLSEFQQKSDLDEATINKIKGLIGEGNADVFVTGEGIVLGDATFASGSDVLTAKGREIIKKLVEQGVFKDGTIYVVGHTDSDPIKRTAGKHTSNYELSAKRAAHVVEYIQSLGVPGERLVIQAHGEYKPNNLPKNKQRRIVLKKIGGN